MNLKYLQYLLHVAETENISQSARELFIAQPALSRLIAEAEKELGYPLFDRLGKKNRIESKWHYFCKLCPQDP